MLHFLQLLISKIVFIYYLFMWVHVVSHVWWSEDNLWEYIFYFYFYYVILALNLGVKHTYLLRCLAGSLTISSYLLILWVWMFSPVCMSVSHMCLWCLKRSEVGIGSPGTRVLGLELGTSGTAASALNLWGISLALPWDCIFRGN